MKDLLKSLKKKEDLQKPKTKRCPAPKARRLKSQREESTKIIKDKYKTKTLNKINMKTKTPKQIINKK